MLNSATTEARKKYANIWNSRILSFLNVCLTYFKNNQIFLNKISRSFVATTKLFTGWSILLDKTYFITEDILEITKTLQLFLQFIQILK